MTKNIFTDILSFFARCNIRNVTIFWNTLLIVSIIIIVFISIVSWWLFSNIIMIGDSNIQNTQKTAISTKKMNEVITDYREKKLEFESLKH